MVRFVFPPARPMDFDLVEDALGHLVSSDRCVDGLAIRQLPARKLPYESGN
jgi:hypothetical protein